MKFVKLKSMKTDNLKPVTVREGHFKQEDLHIGFTVMKIDGEVPKIDYPGSAIKRTKQE